MYQCPPSHLGAMGPTISTATPLNGVSINGIDRSLNGISINGIDPSSTFLILPLLTIILWQT